jgi:hypothetical protein
MTQERYPEKAIEYLDEKFPKGDKRRGEAMVLLAIAFQEGEQEIIRRTKGFKGDKPKRLFTSKELQAFGEFCMNTKSNKKSKMTITIKEDKYDKLHQHLTNLEEMLNHQLYCLFIELTDMRGAIKDVRRELVRIKMEERK